MDELDKALQNSLAGAEAAAAREAFCRCLATWGIPAPDAPLLVSDFGLGEFARTGLVEAWIANEMKAGYCAKYLFVLEGQSCPRHAHRLKTETFFILKGDVAMDAAGAARPMAPGAALRIDPGVVHGFTGVGGPALLLEVSTPCWVNDNYFENPAIPFGGDRTNGGGA